MDVESLIETIDRKCDIGDVQEDWFNGVQGAYYSGVLAAVDAVRFWFAETGKVPIDCQDTKQCPCGDHD